MNRSSDYQLKKLIVDMVVEGGDGHIPSAFSIFDIIAVVYRDWLNINSSNYNSELRDYFILSKGHGCLALYAILYDIGILTDREISGFCKFGGVLGEHPDLTKAPGAEASSGSLGHGLPFAVGIAYGLRKQQRANKVVVLVGDGECHEGSVWEAANLAVNHGLSNLTVIVDLNGSAAQLLPIDNMVDKWSGFGWAVIEVLDGNDKQQIMNAFIERDSIKEGPAVIVAHTTKGNGVSMLEGHGPWHHKIPDQQEYDQILKELA